MLSKKLLFIVLIVNICIGAVPLLAQDEDVEVITPENASRLEETRVYGRGLVLDTAWSSNNHIAVATTAGVLLFDGQDLNSEPLALEQLISVGRNSSLAFSPDGSLLGVGLEFGLVQLFDVETGELLTEFEGQGGAITSVVISSENQVVFSGDENGNLIQWDLQNFEQSGELRAEGGNYSTVMLDINADETLLAFAVNKQITLWDIQAEEEINTFTIEESSFQSIAFSPDSQYLASTIRDGDGAVWIWDVTNGTQIAHFDNGYSASDVVFSADSETVYVSGGETINQWDVNSGEIVGTIDGNYMKILNLSPDGTILLTAYTVPEIHLWDITDEDSQEPVAVIDGFDYVPFSIAFNPDGQMIAYVAMTPFLATDAPVLWDLETETVITRFPRTDSAFEAVLGFSPDGRYVVLSSDYNTRIFDTMTFEEVQSFSDGWNIIDFSPDGSQIAGSLYTAGNDNQKVSIFDVERGRPIGRFTRNAIDIAFSEDGQELNIIYADNTHHILDIEARTIRLGDTRATVEIDYRVKLSPSGNYFTSTDDEDRVIVWDAVTGDQVFNTEPVRDLSPDRVFSPDERLLVIADGRVIMVWDVTTGELLAELEGHRDRIWLLEFTPDGKTLVSSSLNVTWRMWQVTSER